MKPAEKGKPSPQDFDLRIRERSIAKGVIEPKALDKYLADLPDLQADAETITVEQPALDEDEFDEPREALGSA